MLENIKEQFKSGKSFTQSKYYGHIKRELWPKFYWDLYPLAQDYYHELNPYFLFNMYRPEFYKFTKVLTVRDGTMPFANFMLTNFATFSKLEVGTLLIHPDLAPMIPPNLASYFATWKIVQKKQTELHKAKKVFIFGFVSEQYLGTLDQIREKVKPLKDISPDAEVSLLLPIRKNVFELKSPETTTIHYLMDAIKDTLPGRKLKILTGDQFFDVTDFKNSYLYDLALDNFIVTDNYLHYYTQARGATVNNNSLKEAPQDSMFSLELSFNHDLHVCPLPKGKNIFADLLMFKKEYPSVKEYLFDPLLHSIVREGLK